MSSNTNIGNTPVNQGYVQLIHTGETGGIDGTLRTLYDGDGTASDLQIASNKVKVSTELFIGSDTLQEYIQDTVGAMLVTNASHTNLSAAYDDAGDGAIDLTASGEVTLTGSQTLSNKTLAAPTLTGTTQGASITLSGDLTVNGTTTTVNQTNLDVSDNIIGLNRGASTNANDSGLIIERGSTGDNAAIIWDESADKFTLGTTTSTPSATGDLTISTGTLVATIEGNVTGNVTGSASLNLLKSSNLSDLASASTARSNLGVDAAGTDNSTNVTLANTNYLSISGQEITGGTIPVSSGGTGSTNAGNARIALGLGTLAELSSIQVANFLASAITTSSESFADNDTTVMTSAAINDRIESFGYVTSSGISFDGSTANGVLTFKDSDEATVEANLTFDGTSLGVGTASPEGKVHIYQSDAGVAPHGDGDDLVLESNADTGISILSGEADGETGAIIFGSQNDSFGAALQYNYYENRLKLFTGNDTHSLQFSSANNVLAMTIDSSQRVGIGTNSPSTKLAVDSGTSGTHQAISVERPNSSVAALFIGTKGNSNDAAIAANNSNLTFGKDFSDTYTEYMRINTSGNVGIGEDSIDAKLHLTTASSGLINQKFESVGSSAWRIGIPAGQTYFAFDDSSDDLSSPEVVFTTAGNVGIGISSPEGRLHIFNGDASVAPDSDGDELVVENSGDSGISILSGESSTHTGSLIFGSASDGNGAGVVWSHHDKILNVKTQNTAGILRFASANNSEAMRILANGNVGINTASPSYLLDVHGVGRIFSASGDADLRIEGGASNTTSFMIRNGAGNNRVDFLTGGANAMTINSSQRVGIGTTSPATKLHLMSGDLFLTANSTSADSGQGIYWQSTTGGWNTGQALGAIFGKRVDASNGYLRFDTRSSGTTAERMRINQSGNVGIGTTSPSDKLEIAGPHSQLRLTDSDDGQFIQMSLSSDALLFRHNTTSGTSAVAFKDDGNVGIGTNAPGRPLVVNGSSATFLSIVSGQNDDGGILFGDSSQDFDGQIRYHNNDHYMFFKTSNVERMRLLNTGALHLTNDVVAFSSTPSDKKLKTNVKDIEYGLDTIMKLKPKQYDWKKDNRKDIGFIAQEVEEVIPEIVKDNEWFDDKIKTMDYEKLTAVLIKAVQEQQKQINELKEKLNG